MNTNGSQTKTMTVREFFENQASEQYAPEVAIPDGGVQVTPGMTVGEFFAAQEKLES